MEVFLLAGHKRVDLPFGLFLRTVYPVDGLGERVAEAEAAGVELI